MTRRTSDEVRHIIRLVRYIYINFFKTLTSLLFVLSLMVLTQINQEKYRICREKKNKNRVFDIIIFMIICYIQRRGRLKIIK